VSACLHCRGENCENVAEIVRVEETEDVDDPDFDRNVFDILDV
jgi:hypothetical protein